MAAAQSVPIRHNILVMLQLRAIRKRSGLTLQAVATSLGIDHTTLQRWETGKRDPSVSDILRLADLYGVHPGEIFRPLPGQDDQAARVAAIAAQLPSDRLEHWLAVGMAMLPAAPPPNETRDRRSSRRAA
ncbi:helix-turn-helix domain-containing protein [Zavarzinia sp. CC-PAN008]|uniref:helix-turn-helix domain-containing protein n=1 Tax=Zavarzinia sp. CC-PAN008 TaxID=3243332 RepID=UPI003F746087